MSKKMLLLVPMLVVGLLAGIEARADAPGAAIVLVAKPAVPAQPAPRPPAPRRSLVPAPPPTIAHAAVVTAMGALKLPSSPPSPTRAQFAVSPASLVSPHLSYFSIIGADQVGSNAISFGNAKGTQMVWLVLGTGAWVAGSWIVDCDLGSSDQALQVRIYGQDAANGVTGTSEVNVTGVGPHFVFGMSLPPGTVSAGVQFSGIPGKYWGWDSCTFEPK